MGNTFKYLQIHVKQNKKPFYTYIISSLALSLRSLNMSFAFKLHYHAE